MKYKSRRHKSENTFTFVPFSERIAAVNVDVSHRIDRTRQFDGPSDSQSHFGVALEKWTELNCTDDFDAFRKEISGHIQTFAQLVHCQEQVVAALQKHLRVPDSKALESLLDLVVKLAQDLQGDFYKHFDEFFAIITGLLNAHLLDSEVLEKGFTCLSYLFKFLWRHMVADFQHVYRLYSPLLKSGCKEYVRKFASESFAYLMRKVKDRQSLFQFIFRLLQEEPEQAAGVGQLLFEMLRGVRQQLHSCAPDVLPLLLGFLAEDGTGSASVVEDAARAADRWLDVLRQMFRHVAEFLTKEHSGIILAMLSAHLERILTEVAEQPSANDTCVAFSSTLRRVVQVAADWIGYKSAVLVADCGLATNMVLKCFAAASNWPSLLLNRQLCEALLQIITDLLLHRSDLPVECVRRLLSAAFDSGCGRSTLFAFARSLFVYPMFEKDVLPRLLHYIESLLSVSCRAPKADTSDITDVNGSVLMLVAQLVLCKQPLRADPSDSARPPAGCSTSSLDLGVLPAASLADRRDTVSASSLSFLVGSTITDPDIESSCRDGRFWAALLCLPHFRLEDKNAVVAVLLRHLEILGSRMLNEETIDSSQTGLLMSFSHLMQVVTSLESFEQIAAVLSHTTMVAIITAHGDSCHVLRSADFYFTAACKDIKKNKSSSGAAAKVLLEETRLSLLPSLKQQLSSPSSEVRRLALRILCIFPTTLVDREPTDTASPTDDHRPGVYRICLQSEEAECGVHTYRDKLLELRKLDSDNVRSQLPSGGGEDDVPLRYLLGVLYVNFSLLWDPVIELIRSHARGLPKQTFWDVYGNALQTAANLCVNSADSESDSSAERPKATKSSAYEEGGATSSDNLCSLLSAESSKLCRRSSLTVLPDVSDRLEHADHLNHRELLWRAMHGFAELCETKSRIIVPLLFDFLEKEYYLADLYAAPAEDLCRQRNCDSIEAGEEHAGDSKSIQRKPNRRPRGAASTLIAHLTLFSKFCNPRSLYWEPRLRALYSDLLCHRDIKVQRLALSCMMAYKDNHLTPYADQLQALLDDAQFKNALVLFGSDVSADDSSERPCLKEADRSVVLPIVIRMLYARMLAKTGKDTAGKAKAGVRRSMVLRFLATCRSSELHVFFELLLEPFKRYIADPDQLSHHLDSTVAGLDPRHVVPPVRRQVGVLSAIETVIEKLAHLLLPDASPSASDSGPQECYARSILHVIIGVSRQCSSLLEIRAGLTHSAVNALKLHLRPAGLARLTQFFGRFDSYDYASSELDAVFDAAVWPQLSKLSVEGVYSPTPLLHLLYQWSCSPRYFPLLAKCSQSDSSSPLSCLMALLVAKGTHQTVSDMIMEIVGNLLSLGHDDEDAMDTDSGARTEPAKPLVVNGVIQIVAVPVSSDSHPAGEGETPSYGTCLVLPYVSFILSHIAKAVRKFESATGDRKARFPAKELTVLSSISSYVQDAEQSGILVQLLLPFLAHGSQLTETAQVDILESMANLAKHASNVESLDSGFAELLSLLKARVARDALVSLYKKLAVFRPSHWNQPADIVTKLNAWHRVRLDEPDYDTRLAALQALCREGSYSPGSDMVLARSCSYIIATADDMSLRDNASYTLRSLIQRLPAELLSTVVFRHILPDLQKGLRHKSWTVRSEFISTLSVLVRKFPSEIPFCDFVHLMDTADAEVDFFENLRHIQNHRKARALRRLAKCMSAHPMRASCLTSYVLPIVRSFFEDDEFVSDSNIMDAAVEALGAVCCRLPWRSYQAELRRYMRQLERDLTKQKLAVRVFVAVLDAFHFDLVPSAVPAGHAALAAHVAPAPKATALGAGFASHDGSSRLSTPSPDLNGGVGEKEEDAAPQPEGELCQPVNAATAAKIQATLLNDIIPKLQESLTRKVASDDEHKLTRSGFVEDSEVLRVPVALALLKLFQKLPDEILNQHLPGLLLKVCVFLRSRSRDIRHAARDTLVKMLECLGPAKFPVILRELRESLTRGYQLHVLNFTVHSLLKSMIPKLGTGALDGCLDSLTSLFNEELFGKVSEEKEVEGITGKLMEAKACKSYDAYTIVARFVSAGALVRFMQPLKEILDSAHSSKVLKKAQETLRMILSGLMANEGITAETYLIFVHGIVTESLPLLKSKKDARTHGRDSKEGSDARLRPPSCLLIPKAPGRVAPVVSVGKTTNTHVLIEFGLMFLHSLLKKSKVTASDAEHLRMLDPFVAALTGCLSSKHVRVITASLHCLLWLCRFPLPSLQQNIRSVVESLFVTLKNYTSAGAAKGDNLELLTLCFKTITAIIRDVEYYRVDDNQLAVLLTYAEADLHDHSRQAAAFSLLKAILSRRLVVPEIYDVIEKVAKLSVQSDAPHVRLQCRQVVLQFMLDYPLGRKIRRYIEFYATNIEYGVESGRESVLEMMASMFSSFPQTLLVQYSGMLYVVLGRQLVNDDSARCRHLTALTIKTLIGKLESASRDELLGIAKLWLAEPKVVLKRLGAQVMGLFVEVEATRFERHLGTVLPLLEQYTEPGRFTKQATLENPGEEPDSSQDDVDLHLLLFDVLMLFLKVVRECPSAAVSSPSADSKFAALNLPVWENVQRHLLHPHSWVRLAAAQLFGQLFSLLDVQELILLGESNGRDARSKGNSATHLWCDTKKRLRDLSADFCTQLHSPLLTDELALQIVKNLVFLGKVIKDLPPDIREKSSAPDASDDDNAGNGGKSASRDVTLSLKWLIRRLCREANYEAIQEPKSAIRRTSVFKWFGAMALELGTAKLADYLDLMMPPLYRETTKKKSTASTDNVSVLAAEVMDLLKTTAGLDAFTQAYSVVRATVSERKELRKRTAAVEAVAHPDVAARKKMKKNLSKKEAKKRRMVSARPMKGLKTAAASRNMGTCETEFRDV